MLNFKDSPGTKTFSTFPLEKGEQVINLAASKDHVVAVTNKGNCFVIDAQGIAKRVIFEDNKPQE